MSENKKRIFAYLAGKLVEEWVEKLIPVGLCAALVGLCGACDHGFPKVVECGNGTLEYGEECDDGQNGDPCDGCLDDCTVHSNFCGDGYICGNSAQGLCDLAGNVWEWVEDDYHADYNGAPTDGSAWVDDPRGANRVARGGSFGTSANDLCASYRWGYASPSDNYYFVGFRCVR